MLMMCDVVTIAVSQIKADWSFSLHLKDEITLVEI